MTDGLLVIASFRDVSIFSSGVVLEKYLYGTKAHNRGRMKS